MAKYWIGGIRGVGPVNVTASRYRDAVAKLRASFGNQEIIPSVFLVDMWRFGVTATGSVPYPAAFCKLSACQRVYLAKPYPDIRIADHVAFPIFKIERWVNTALLQPHRFTPSF